MMKKECKKGAANENSLNVREDNFIKDVSSSEALFMSDLEDNQLFIKKNNLVSNHSIKYEDSNKNSMFIKYDSSSNKVIAKIRLYGADFADISIDTIELPVSSIQQKIINSINNDEECGLSINVSKKEKELSPLETEIIQRMLCSFIAKIRDWVVPDGIVSYLKKDPPKEVVVNYLRKYYSFIDEEHNVISSVEDISDDELYEAWCQNRYSNMLMLDEFKEFASL